MSDGARKWGRPSRPAESLLLPLAGLYKGVVEGRNFAFDQKLFKAKAVDRPVVSVGNITSGGTGKTPLTAYLIEGFVKRGKRVGLVSRGYGGEEKGPAQVPSDGSAETARRFGDETSWLAKRFPDVPVVVCPKRVDAAELLIKQNQVDLILADDAFQHRWLHRNLDIVVLDPTEPAWHYRPLPLGREREGFEALKRAQAIFITKTNLAEEARVNWLRKRISSVLKGLAGHPQIFEIESRLNGFMPLDPEREVRAVNSFQGEKVLLASGIGRPHTFAKLARMDARAEILEHLVFGDHHSYTPANLEDIEIRAVRLGATAILVTEKDAVKMTNWRPRVPCYASRLELRPRTDLGSFYEAVDRLRV